MIAFGSILAMALAPRVERILEKAIFVLWVHRSKITMG